MTVTLRLSRATFAFLIAITSATAAYAAAVLPLFLSPAIVMVTVPFIAAISSALIVYLGTEEQGAPT